VGRPIALAAALAVFAAGCGGGGSSTKGFLDPANLQESIRSQTEEVLADPANAADREDSGIPEGTGVSDVICIRSTESERKFDCKVRLSNGDGETLKVIVSEDGESWVPAAD
jgi:hypothetical protein